MSMDSLYKASYQVMVNEEEGMSTKLRQLVMAGLIKEKMCALINVSAMTNLLEQGLDSQDENL